MDAPRLPLEPSSERRALLAAYLWRRAEGELTSFHAFSHLIDDLAALGLPEELLGLARDCQTDERKHSDWCRDAALAIGHAGGVVRARSEAPLRFRGASDLENRVLRLALCCLNETYGCVLLRDARRSMTEASLRSWNRAHLSDEVRHARLGWAFLAALRAEHRAIVDEWLPKLLAAHAQSTGVDGELEEPALISGGYYTPSQILRTQKQALDELIRPGLAHLGFRHH